jgi:hypothetical protein
MTAEKRRLELENEVVREKELLMLRQEAEAYPTQSTIHTCALAPVSSLLLGSLGCDPEQS